MGIINSRRQRHGKRDSSKDSLKAPISTLTKMLMKLTFEKKSMPETIHRDVFTNHLFKQYPELSEMMFTYLTDDFVASPPLQAMSTTDFHDKVEEIISAITYQEIFRIYMTIFYGNKSYVTRDDFQSIVKMSYNVFLDNHPDGPQVCPYEENTINSFLQGIFDNETQLKLSNLQELTEQHCPRMLIMLHSYVTNHLRSANSELFEKKKKGVSTTSIKPSKSSNSHVSKSSLVAPSKVWVLATILPNIYLHPFCADKKLEMMSTLSKQFTDLMSEYSYPTHWCPLYDSTQHGFTAEAFLHNIEHYRGPSILFLLGKRDKDFCVCVSDEWHDSQLYWGDINCFLIQLSPKYRVLHRGPNIINMCLSGDKPKGIEIGNNPVEPTLSVNENLTRMTFNGKKYKIHTVEVWGCGPPKVKELQIDIKNWDTKNDVKEKLEKSHLRNTLEREESKIYH